MKETNIFSSLLIFISQTINVSASTLNCVMIVSMRLDEKNELLWRTYSKSSHDQFVSYCTLYLFSVLQSAAQTPNH